MCVFGVLWSGGIGIVIILKRKLCNYALIYPPEPPRINRPGQI